MSSRSFLKDELYDYLLAATLKPGPLMERSHAETEQKTGPWAGMQISEDARVSSVPVPIGDGLTIARKI